MKPTILKYMDHGDMLADTATVIDVTTREDGKQALVLDQTIFYPQGGDLPYNQGTITSNNGTFNVQDVRFKNGIVYHIGQLSGTLDKGSTAILTFNKERRALY